MPRVFINYRRADSIAYAGRVYDRLAQEFGAQNVFMDIDTIRLGEDFVEVLHETALSCDAFLAVIGPQWLTVKDKDGRVRLGTAQDFVALEIAAALERDSILVVPVLVGGAKMPDAGELPKELAELARRQALVLPDVGFHRTMGDLVESIRGVERAQQEREQARAQDEARKREEDAERRRRPPDPVQGWTTGQKAAAGVASVAVLGLGLWLAAPDDFWPWYEPPSYDAAEPPAVAVEPAKQEAAKVDAVRQEPSATLPPGMTTGSKAAALVNQISRADLEAKVDRQIVYRYRTIGEYENAVRAKPNDADLRHDFAGALEQAGDSETALEQYRLSTTTSPNQIGRAFLYRDYAEALAKRGRVEEAIAAAQKSVVSWPRANSRSCFGSPEETLLSRLLVQKGDTNGAVAMWQETRRKDTANAAKCDEQIARVRGQVR